MNNTPIARPKSLSFISVTGAVSLRLEASFTGSQMEKGCHITLCSFIHHVNRSRHETDHPPVQNTEAQYSSPFLARFLTQPP